VPSFAFLHSFLCSSEFPNLLVFETLTLTNLAEYPWRLSLEGILQPFLGGILGGILACYPWMSLHGTLEVALMVSFGHHWGVLSVYLGYPLGIIGVSLGYPWGILGISFGYHWGILRVSLGYP